MLFRQIFNETTPEDWWQPLTGVFGTSTSSGELITPEGAFGGLGVVFACIERRANALAKLPLQLYKKKGDSRTRDTSHTISYLLEKRPNTWQTPTQFKKYIIACQLLWGNAFIHMKFDRTGTMTALEPLNPSTTQIIKDSNGYYWFHSLTRDNKPLVLHEDEIIHVPYISDDGKRGRAPLTVARENAGILQAMQKFEGNFYKNGTLKKGALKIPQTLNKEAKNKIKEEWRALYGGVANTGDVAVLDGGIEWQDISLPLKDAEFVLGKKLTTVEIANIFNVPSFMLNDMDRSTFNNVEQQNMRFILDVIQPDCIAIEEELNYKLFTTKEALKYYAKFNLTSALRADSQSRAQYYKELLGMGIISINEVRALEEMDSIGDMGDKHYFSLNYTTLDTLEQHQRILKGGEE